MADESIGFYAGGMTLKQIIRNLEKRQRDLEAVIAALRILQATGKPSIEVESLDQMEKRMVAGALIKSDGNQSRAAKLLHVGRDRLRSKMRKHGIGMK